MKPTIASLKSLLKYGSLFHQIPKFFNFTSSKSLHCQKNRSFSVAINPENILPEISKLPGIKKKFNINLDDISLSDIEETISPILGINNLKKSNKTPESYKNINGIIWGDGLRIFLPMVLDNGQKKIDAVFLIITSSPQTFISEKTMKTLFNSEFGVSGYVKIDLNGYDITVLGRGLTAGLPLSILMQK